MKKKNSYEKKAQKKQLLEGVAAEHAKGDFKKTAMETGRDILIGAVGGGLAGAVLGRSSFLVGVAVTGVGHYMGSSGAAAFGVGMMASGGYQAVAGAMNGPEKEGFEGVKERMSAFKDEFKRKLFLDKIIKSKKKEEEKSEEGTNGMGEVQYFTYPNAKELEGTQDHLKTLEQIEKQVEESAKKFEAKQSVSGGLEGEMGMTDVSDQNF
ncbi:MAG: hypothetical protein Q8T03_13390 [Bacteroidota bacterium]|nr:hypothetical protein [Bacteroidota bacterium]MDP3558360.1 hypothetical protein [Bacteroidota bacterium]